MHNAVGFEGEHQQPPRLSVTYYTVFFKLLCTEVSSSYRIFRFARRAPVSVGMQPVCVNASSVADLEIL